MEREYVIKRTVIEEFYVMANTRAEALKIGPEGCHGPANVTVVKETCVPSTVKPARPVTGFK